MILRLVRDGSLPRAQKTQTALDLVVRYRVYSLDMNSLTIGQLAQQAAIHPESVRFYEAQELLPKPPRSAGGYRLYPPQTVARIRFIKRAQDLGFTLREVKELLSLADHDGTDCADVRALAQAKVDEISEKIRVLEQMRIALKAVTEACPGRGSAVKCSILETFRSDAQ